MQSVAHARGVAVTTPLAATHLNGGDVEMAIEKQYKGRERFGGSKLVTLPDGTTLSVGDLNTFNGTTMLPWHLRRYTKCLRLSINELVLLESFIIRQWEEDKSVWLSMEKWGRQLGVHRTTLMRARDKLEAKGYIEPIGMRQFGIAEYQVTGALLAMSLCVMCDPSGTFAKEQGYCVTEAQAHAQMAEWGYWFDLDFEALAKLGP